MIMGVVADDITGANDIGGMFARSGLVAHVYPARDGGTLQHAPRHAEADSCILDTDSRFDAPGVAYDKVFAATRALQGAGCERFFNKTCSVFRGNIGAEFDAMLDALGERFAVVVLGFPKNGRTTVGGIHFVHGQRLEESEFRHDPMHPMTCSNLVEILQGQTERTVGLLTHETITQGPTALRAHIERMRSHCTYLILDVPDQAALTTIARAVADCKVLCGSSALVEELAPLLSAPPVQRQPVTLPPPGGSGVLCVAGSLMPQTRAQLHHLRATGLPAWEMDSRRLLDPAERAAEMARLADTIAPRLLTSEDQLLYAANDPATVEQTHAEGTRRGLARAEVARLVSQALAVLAATLAARAGTNRFVVAGGDTSAALCAALDITGLRVWQEIQPGLPSCLSLSDPPRLLVLKSGSFGTADFLAQAIAHVRGA